LRLEGYNKEEEVQGRRDTSRGRDIKIEEIA
jgi:hypothetical protein